MPSEAGSSSGSIVVDEGTGRLPAHPESPESIARDIAAVGQLEAVPLLLEVLCETTGMGFAAVARVSDETWTLCAVKDQINFGLQPGGQLELESTLCVEARRSRSAIVIEHASQDPRYRDHHTPRIYNIESYVSVPIELEDGRYFGNLCAIDPRPAKVMDPKVIHMFQRFADIIAKQLDSELRHERGQSALRDAQASNELREQFIAILGHDLRNPLQAVSMTSAVMEASAPNATMKELASRISTNARRMSRLIDDILDFARGRLGGGIGISMDEAGEVNAALIEVVRELQDGQPKRVFVVDIRATSPVRCDISRIQQLTSNLVGNALTHGDPEQPVEIRAYTHATEFVLAVSNQGEPIPEVIQAKIFEPFWRRAADPHREGLGLGLSICSQIVRAHGGTLSVSSTEEQGTTFTARLPLRAV